MSTAHYEPKKKKKNLTSSIGQKTKTKNPFKIGVTQCVREGRVRERKREKREEKKAIEEAGGGGGNKGTLVVRNVHC